MAIRTFPITTSSIAAKRTSGPLQVAGKTHFVAATFDKDVNYYGFMRAQIDAIEWSDVKKITKAELVFRVPSDVAGKFSFGSPKANSGATLAALAAAFPDNDSASFVNHSQGMPAKSTKISTIPCTFQATVDVEQ